MTPNHNDVSQIPSALKARHDSSIKTSEHSHSDMESVASNVNFTNHTARNFTTTASAFPEIHDNAKRTQHHEEQNFYSSVFLEDSDITHQILSLTFSTKNEDA